MRGREVDKALLAGLEKCGFRLHFGEDETGFQMMYLRRGGGYYFNVGCSELIISGQVKLLQYADIETFEAEGARLHDGSVARAELVVLATGYKNQQDTVRAFLGDEIADAVGPVWGFDDGGELRNIGVAPPSRASGSSPAASRNAEFSRATWRCRSRRWKKGC